MTIFWICVVIGALVLGFMVFLIIKYRKKEGVEPADFDDNPKLELTWTILFAVILVGMAIPATTTMIKAYDCLLYTSPSPRDRTRSRMPSSA